MFRVILITSTYPRDEGDYAVPWMREAVRRLADRGHRITVLAPAYRGSLDHEIDGVRVRRFRYAPRAWERLTHEEGAPAKIKNPLFQALAVPYVLAGRAAAARLAREEPADVVHVHWPFPHGPIARAAARVCDAGLVASCHGAELALARRKSWVRPLLRKALLEAHVLISNSSHTAVEVQRLSGRDSEVIPYGTSVRVHARASVKEEPDAPPVILFTGRLIQRKGVEYLLRALPEVLAARRVRVEITGDGDERARLEELRDRLGLGDVVRFRGFLSTAELEEAYASCDVYVLPSVTDDRGDTEGLGVTTIEAMQHRRPVVATATGGIVDVVEDGRTGLLVPEKDASALARAILRLLDDPEEARRLADAGCEHARTCFDWENITDRVERAWAAAAARRGLACRTGVGESASAA